MQSPHLAPTYAAVNALCELGTAKALKVINRYKSTVIWKNRLSYKEKKIVKAVIAQYTMQKVAYIFIQV